MADNSNTNSWKDPAIWGRAVAALLYLLVLALAVGPLAIVLGVAQAVFTIVSGEDNRNLRDFAAVLAKYIHQILLFASWNQEQKPFPMSEFPSVGEREEPMPGGGAGMKAAEPASERGEPVSEPESPIRDSGGEESVVGTDGEANPENRVCPECNHAFQGRGWEGLDAHWRSKHEHLMPYEEAGPLVRTGKYRPGSGGESD